jgi:hypothetical protein
MFDYYYAKTVQMEHDRELAHMELIRQARAQGRLRKVSRRDSLKAVYSRIVNWLSSTPIAGRRRAQKARAHAASN